MGKPIGFIPAAGRGVRFGATGYSKELFPLLLSNKTSDEPLAPRPVCELALRGIQLAGAARCVVLVSSEKADILRVLGDGTGVDLSLAYVVQSEPQGLPHGLRCAHPWLGNSDVLLALPDTVILPGDAVAQVHTHRLACGADLALGLFAVEEPERLGPVAVSDDGVVLEIFDKPGQTALTNSWGVASWSSAFTDFCCEWDRAAPPDSERVIGHAFEAARRAGMSVTALELDGGTMLDIGTPRGLRAALATLAAHGVVDAR